ncbi:S8 family serine peptidase [Nocardioides lianchengensis]|uniref:Peptidase inhibitor I9 n=1 Tax=Nocardioides lianchengensis TaxID=1045774 RepID=A0A1G6I803_9ACTN|nr:S8 family serine peptidase [Nocardioides lianchengensis]NYG13135.1 subtilisin family serine protease [Nocardioides lianchengensis]SDC02644.1 Peptidase inhibitor I9 [Nocardioides lianchengensis]
MGSRRRTTLLGALAAALLVTPLAPAEARTATVEPATDLFLVTLDTPGAAGRSAGLSTALDRFRMTVQQDAVLVSVAAPRPVYRWTTALNGVAVELTDDQAQDLQADGRVVSVERNEVRPLAGTVAPASSAAPVGAGRARGGAGVVIGVVDTGLDADHPLFASTPGLADDPEGFTGPCQTGEGWSASSCTAKVMGARWFVDGFGADRTRSSEQLSARDDDGHGTLVASIAAGDAGVRVRTDAGTLGRYSGEAPDARLAVYKACWTAPEPRDDGCATADLVTAIDRATADGVDVLNLSVGGPAQVDTVERALLGATESGVVVVAAAGNQGGSRYAAHPSPWVTTVGGSTGVERTGRVVLGDGPRLRGAMLSARSVGPARLVVGADVPAAGSTRAAARACEPGSLDAGRVAGRVVLCERGRVGRVDKSAAVRRADGVGMVLVNTGPASRNADLHSVPTVHLDARAGRVVRRWAARHPAGELSLRPLGPSRAASRVLDWSGSGDPTATVLKPDLVAPATGRLGAVPARVRSSRWDLASGTSVASAQVAGAAALLVARHPDWSVSAVRSALVTTASTTAGGSVLDSGAGRLRADAALRPGLAYEIDPADYRRWLDGRRVRLNTPSAVLHAGQDVVRRTITNQGRRTRYFSSSTSGFRRHGVTLTPAAVRLKPGESATWTLRVTGPDPRPFDDGYVTWTSGDGTVTRIPVLLTR